jgi:hypothetical protein
MRVLTQITLIPQMAADFHFFRFSISRLPRVSTTNQRESAKSA